MGGCGLALGAHTVRKMLQHEQTAGLKVGFRNDAPRTLWRWSKEAEWYEMNHGIAHCTLCPHECRLHENDRGFCRTRVVKDGKLHTLAYGNPCSVHIDPMEKKPLYHFLPGTSIFSVATAGCNLRCLNCQNWQISQSRPEDTRNRDLFPEELARVAAQSGCRAIAYTYSDPIIFYEYAKDAAMAARERGLRNVWVTAGYILEQPLREICQYVDAANVDLKGFSDAFYKKVTGARLEPVLRCLEVMKEEGVWVEVTRLIVPTYSDDLDDIRRMCDWLVRKLGPGTPIHFSRFHPAHKLTALPSTPVETMYQAQKIAQAAGLHFVFVGNVPGSKAQNTDCPRCGLRVIERQGYRVPRNTLKGGACSCGEIIPGVWI